jgi:hypothetical protein
MASQSVVVRLPAILLRDRGMAMPKNIPVKTTEEPDPLLDADEASGREARCSRSKWYASGMADEIESVRIGGRRFWRRSKVRQHIQSLTVPAIKQAKRRKRPVRKLRPLEVRP